MARNGAKGKAMTWRAKVQKKAKMKTPAARTREMVTITGRARRRAKLWRAKVQGKANNTC
jgi:hypothetical protein